jgi:hypothetical protein
MHAAAGLQLFCMLGVTPAHLGSTHHAQCQQRNAADDAYTATTTDGKTK